MYYVIRSAQKGVKGSRWETFHSRTLMMERVHELKEDPETKTFHFGTFHHASWDSKSDK